MTGLVTVELTEKHVTAGERAVDRRLSRERNCPVAHALAAAGFENPRVRMQVFTAGADRVDVAGTGKVTVDTFTGGELEPSRRCCLCRCDATAEAYGLPVCGYHVDHTEDDPQCPRCAADARLLVAVGDRVRDPQDGAWREIVRIDDDEGTVYMRDGGCMSVRECAAAEKRLPSESLCPACEAWADGGRILTEEQWAAAVDELCIECGAAGRTRGMHA